MTEYIGQTIGNYQIESLLGSGGMGQVFRARHIHLDRPAALKLLHGNLAQDPMFQARFRHEAQAAARLRHPHIVEVYDFDEYNGMAYLVMELVVGGSMRGWLRSAGQQTNGSLAQGLELVRQAADALAYAHAMGMVHRDIKPDNLLLQPGVLDGAPVMKVADFGLARMADGSNLTATGMAMGTPAYMSPEQCQGKELDGRSDIYALGVVLYEVATGTLPFVVKTVSEAVFKHVYVPAPSPRQVRPELPEAIETIIARCLAKTAEERFATAADLAAALYETIRLVAPELAAGGENGAALTEIAARTRIQAAGPAMAPAVLTVMGGSPLPRIQVLDDAGTLLQVVAVRPAGLTVGRVERNDVVLGGEGVSRHHVHLAWDGTQVLVTDLGSSNGTLLGEQRLPPQQAVPWPWRTLLRVGSYWLRLDPPESEAGRSAATAPTVATPGRGVMTVPAPGSDGMPLQYSQAFVTTGRVGVVVEPEALAVTPGQVATVAVTLANLSEQVDHLVVSVTGVPEEWVTLPPAVQLSPGGQATVNLTVRSPAEPETRAGEYPVEVVARSRARPAEGGTVLARWTVRPYTKEELSLTPARVRGRGRGQMKAVVQNLGNATVRYRLKGEAEEAGMQVTLAPEELVLAPGESGSASVIVEGSLKLLGSETDHQVSVTATAEHGAVLRSAGTWLQSSLLPAWSMIAAVLALAFGGACGFGALPVSLAGGLPGYALFRGGSADEVSVAGGVDLATPVTALASVTPTTTEAGATPEAGNATTVPDATPDGSGAAIAATGTAAAAQVVATGTAQAVAAAGGAGAGDGGVGGAGSGGGGNAGAGTPTPGTAPSATATAAPGATVAPTPVPSATPEPTSTPDPTSTLEPSSTPTPTPTSTPTEVPTAVPTATPTETPTATMTPSPSSTPTPTITPSPTPDLFLTTPPAQLAPPDGSRFDIFPRVTTLAWSAVPGAVAYAVEIDCYHCCQAGAWCTDVGRTWQVQRGITATQYTFQWVGAQPGRWRVWALDAAGREGPRTGWWVFEYLR